jgi:hypothetical protein
VLLMTKMSFPFMQRHNVVDLLVRLRIKIYKTATGDRCLPIMRNVEFFDSK